VFNGYLTVMSARHHIGVSTLEYCLIARLSKPEIPATALSELKAQSGSIIAFKIIFLLQKNRSQIQ